MTDTEAIFFTGMCDTNVCKVLRKSSFEQILSYFWYSPIWAEYNEFSNIYDFYHASQTYRMVIRYECIMLIFNNLFSVIRTKIENGEIINKPSEDVYQSLIDLFKSDNSENAHNEFCTLLFD